MMSLIEVQTSEVVKKQIGYKWKAYTGVFTSLVVIQILGLLFSLNGSGSMGSGRTGYDVNITYYTADIVVGFTIFWGFLTAFLLTTKAYREDDFAFVTNRKTSTLSTIAFLFMICVIGALTALLSSFALKLLAYFMLPGEEILLTQGVGDVGPWLIGMLATFLIVFLFSSLGYLAGMIVQLNKMLVIILPVVVVGLMILLYRSGFQVQVYFFEFFFEESNAWLFTLKTLAATTIFYALAVLVSNRLEVKQ
ncbi:hypothetical protein GLV98_13980 [Halobacillus litoralis]|uniref:Uncharacterized protein n=1 Tax=Halobacillus litoralis TaxID=45668 RepID=A0A845E7E9_9BACI|nr:hypothetical protein [Halobacillus litoralis]MYL50603.1 hypothetical protein [Halobacillus litoralis]